ncbi:ArnT family glycosyltransferase [Lentilactobacillus raoultii]|uniref:ArnT family glycosyltransferase n=1 Tax=Lentilactobacillus raoultii TaxID=1987503 RepID=A0ABW3PI63_9LACO|nr:glycosyltransferase family 39 protein [Lentilactobacillus raoultii]
MSVSSKVKSWLSKRAYLGLFLLISIWFMGFVSYTSPLFYFDYSPDNNCFFTVGKALMHGILPYKDVFEQKGPYVYLMHGLASLISSRSLLGIFPFEVLSLFLTMYIVYKIARLNTYQLAACAIAILVPVFQLFHPYYNYGDTVESLLFPAMLALIYVLLKADRAHFVLPGQLWCLQGFLVGLTFLMKYTLLGGWIIFYLAMFGYYVKQKSWREMAKLIRWSLLGFLIATLPWLIFFLATHSLTAFFHVYFYENMHIYMLSDNSVFAKFIESLTIYSSFLRQDPLIFVCGFVGYVYLLFSRSTFQTTWGKMLFVMMMIVNAAFIVYGYHPGQVYQYYELAFFPYLVIPSVFAFTNAIKRFNITINDQNESLVLLSCALISFFLILGVNDNILSSRIFPNNSSVTLNQTNRPQQPAQVEFGKLMRSQSKGRPTLLNYGSIDMGFYTTSGALPSTYYFQNYNIAHDKAPQILNSQATVIKKRQVQWVVLNTPAGKQIGKWHGYASAKGKITSGNINPGTKKIAKSLLKNYRVVTNHTQAFEGANVTYWLLKRKD